MGGNVTGMGIAKKVASKMGLYSSDVANRHGQGFLSQVGANLGTLIKDAGKPAIEKLRESEMWFQRGLDLEESGESSARITEAYQRALELNPEAAGAWVNIGTIYYRQGSVEQAEVCYRRALEVWPDYALAHFNLANV